MSPSTAAVAVESGGTVAGGGVDPATLAESVDTPALALHAARTSTTAPAATARARRRARDDMARHGRGGFRGVGFVASNACGWLT